MNLDPLFSVPSEITIGAPVANPRGDDRSYAARAEAISAAAYNVREVLYRNYARAHPGEEADMLPVEEQTDLLMAAFCDRKNRIAHYTSPELVTALKEFREFVPLHPFNTIDRLATAPLQTQLGDGRKAMFQLQENHITPEEFSTRLRDIAKRIGVDFEEGKWPAESVEQIEKALIVAHKHGTVLHEYAEGSESRVFLAEAGNAVYKCVPFKGEMLQIPPIGGLEEVGASNAYGTFLADQYGGMPLFDRAKLLGSVAGVCRTELVGMTAGGYAVYKQPFLGDKEPSEAGLAEWTQQFGHVGIPQDTAEASPALQDMNLLPFVAQAGEGKFVIGLDLNPRNARVWNGVAVPFDPVLRELKQEEIESHPRIREAVAQISLAKGRGRSVQMAM